MAQETNRTNLGSESYAKSYIEWEKEKVRDVADKLYPTFAELLGKIQEMVQEEMDAKLGVGPMDIDHVYDDQEGEWKAAGQVLSGRGAQGEEVLYMLQKRGNSTRIAPKGGG